MKSTTPQCNFTAGEWSPRALGRFDLAKYQNSCKTIENFLINQVGGAIFRPGTVFVEETKTSAKASRLLRFSYSTTQSYIIEAGDLYFRFYTESGRLENPPGTPVEVTTVFAEANLWKIKYAQNADVMYIATGTYKPYKLERTSATSFTITAVNFVRGPFLDTNITTTTITPSADTGAGITLTASAAIFQSGHVGSLWRVKSGVVKITGYTDTTHVTGTVQAEPDGVAGNLATGPGATADWAEGSWSDVRGWPACVTFNEGRLVFAATSHEPHKSWGSVTFAYENFEAGANDTDAITFEMNADQVNAIRWILGGIKSIQAGTFGGTFNIEGSSDTPITPANPPFVYRSTIYGAADREARKISRYVYYIQKDLNAIRELGYFFDVDDHDALDTTILADHILRDGGGAVDMDAQQFPNDRIWVVRADGQIAVLTRNVRQEVQGWCRIVLGADKTRGAGRVESICVLSQDDADDQIWVIVNRYINGGVKRFVEYFSAEDFDDDFDAVRLDAALTYDSPKTISGATKANPVVITATGHGFSNGDMVRIDNVVGMEDLNTNYYLVANKTANTFELTDTDGNNIDGTAFDAYISGGEVRKMVTAISGLDHLEGEIVAVTADGAVPGTTQLYTVASGAITLAESAAIVHVGLAYEGTLQLNKLIDGDQITGQGKMRRIFRYTARLYRSLGMKFGIDENYLDSVNFDTDPIIGHPPPLFTGDKQLSPDTTWDAEKTPIIKQTSPLPLSILCLIIESETEAKY